MNCPKPGQGFTERSGAGISAEQLPALWARGDEQLSRSYRLCGRVLRLRCDSPAYAAEFENAFGRLRCDGSDAAGEATELTFLTQASGPDGFPALIDLRHDRIRVFDHESVEPTQLFFCLAFVEKRMFPLTDHIILHGSVLEHRGAVTAIVGRTHSGKSTLGLRLALEPDVAFLSDEFCPIRLEDGRVEPFPRCLGLRGHARLYLKAHGALPAELAESSAPQIEIDPGRVRGLCIGQGGPLRNIVFLSAEGVTALNGNVRLLDLQFVTDAVLADLQALPGVRTARVLNQSVGFGATVALDVEPGAHVAKDVIRTCRDLHGMETFGFLPPDARVADFTQPPELSPVAPMRGIIETLRHLVNVEALDGRLGGGNLKLLDCLAASLGKARFFSLRPGPLEETSQLLHELVLQT